MATISDMILSTGRMSPLAALSQGLQAGIGTASNLQNMYGQALRQRYQRQQMKQAQMDAPLHQKVLDAQQKLLDSQIKQADLKIKYPLLFSSSAPAQMVGAQQYLRDLSPSLSSYQMPPIPQMSAMPQMVSPQTPDTMAQDVSQAISPSSFGQVLKSTESVPSATSQMPSTDLPPVLHSSGQGEGQTLADQLENYQRSQTNYRKAFSDYYRKRTQGMNFVYLPQDEKKMVVSYAMGMGLAPQEAVNYFMQGGNLKDLAKEKGIDLKQVEPIFPNQPQAINQIQTRKIALNAVNSIEPEVTKALAPYAGLRIEGRSLKQIADQIKGSNPDGQARFLAAYALQPELSAMRMSALGGRVGIQAIQHISDATFGKLNAFRQMVSPEVFAASQKYLTDWINNSFGAASKSLQTLAPQRVSEGGVASSPSTLIPTASAPVQQPQAVASSPSPMPSPAPTMGQQLSPLTQAVPAGIRNILTPSLLAQAQQPQAPQAPQVPTQTQPLQVPTFNTKAELKTWFMKLTPEQQDEYIKTIERKKGKK